MEKGTISLVGQSGSTPDNNILQKYVTSFRDEIGSLELPAKRKSTTVGQEPEGKVKKRRNSPGLAMEDVPVPKDSKKNCCIPACKFESLPKAERTKRALIKLPLQDTGLLERWLGVIPRTRGSWINGNARVCSYHFDLACVNDSTVKKVLKDGTVVEKVRKRFELLPGSVPSIFPINHTLTKLPTHPHAKRKEEKDILRLQQKVRLSQALEEIQTFSDLCRLVRLHSASLPADWLIKHHNGGQASEAMHFLQLDTTGLRVRLAIAIPRNLRPEMFVHGAKVSADCVLDVLLQDKVTSWPDVGLLMERLQTGTTVAVMMPAPAST